MNEETFKKLTNERDEAVLEKKVLDAMHAELLQYNFQLRKLLMVSKTKNEELQAEVIRLKG